METQKNATKSNFIKSIGIRTSDKSSCWYPFISCDDYSKSTYKLKTKQKYGISTLSGVYFVFIQFKLGQIFFLKTECSVFKHVISKIDCSKCLQNDNERPEREER